MVLFYTNSHFQYISVPFESILLINFFTLVLPRGWRFRAFSNVNFCPEARDFAAFFAWGGGGDFKTIPGGRPGGMLTAGID